MRSTLLAARGIRCRTSQVSVTFVPTVTCRKPSGNTQPGEVLIRRRTAPRRPAAAARRDAGRRSRRRRHRARDGASWPGRVSPGAIRRAVTRKPVWPIILWPGRIERPSTCQSRTSDSQGCGSVNPPCARSVSTVLPSWVVVATYAQTSPPGVQRLGDPVDALPGREHVQDDPVDVLVVEALHEVADGELPGRVPAVEELVDVLHALVGELLAALVGGHLAARARRRAAASRSGRRTRRRPRRPGRPGRCRPSPRSGRRPWGRPPPRARHRDHELVEQRPEHEVLPAGGRGDAEALRRPIRSSWSIEPRLVKNCLPSTELDVVPAALGVGEPDPLTGLQRPAAYAGPWSSQRCRGDMGCTLSRVRGGPFRCLRRRPCRRRR